MSGHANNSAARTSTGESGASISITIGPFGIELDVSTLDWNVRQRVIWPTPGKADGGLTALEHFASPSISRAQVFADKWPHVLVSACRRDFASLLDWANLARDARGQASLVESLLPAARHVIEEVQTVLSRAAGTKLSVPIRDELYSAHGLALALLVQHDGRAFARAEQARTVGGAVFGLCVGTGVATGTARIVDTVLGPKERLLIGCGVSFQLPTRGSSWPALCSECQPKNGKNRLSRDGDAALKRHFACRAGTCPCKTLGKRDKRYRCPREEFAEI